MHLPRKSQVSFKRNIIIYYDKINFTPTLSGGTREPIFTKIVITKFREKLRKSSFSFEKGIYEKNSIKIYIFYNQNLPVG